MWVVAVVVVVVVAVVVVAVVVFVVVVAVVVVAVVDVENTNFWMSPVSRSSPAIARLSSLFSASTASTCAAIPAYAATRSAISLGTLQLMITPPSSLSDLISAVWRMLVAFFDFRACPQRGRALTVSKQPRSTAHASVVPAAGLDFCFTHACGRCMHACDRRVGETSLCKAALFSRRR